MNEKVKKALEFYANQENYRFNTDPYESHDSEIAKDGGSLAKEALKEHGVM